MKKQLLVLLIFSIGIINWQCSRDGAAEQPEVDKNITPVRIMTLSPRPFSEYLEVTGTVEARNHIQIVVEEGGIVHRIKRDKGSLVKKGDTLIVLENRMIEAGYKESNAALHQAELDYKSMKVMYEKRAISENEYLAAKYGLDRARAAFDLAKARYDKLFLKAPLTGYVNNRFYDIGSYAMPMTPILDFMDNAVMKISAGVAERFLNDIHIGTPVEISFDAYPDLKLKSEVSFINRSIDPLSRTFQIEIEIPNPGRKLAPQMIANLKLLRRSYQDRIVIPMDAVIESEQGRFVFVAENDQARKVPIQMLVIYEDSVLVNGLEPGKVLIVMGQQELTDGDSLLIVRD